MARTKSRAGIGVQRGFCLPDNIPHPNLLKLLSVLTQILQQHISISMRHYPWLPDVSPVNNEAPVIEEPDFTTSKYYYVNQIL